MRPATDKEDPSSRRSQGPLQAAILPAGSAADSRRAEGWERALPWLAGALPLAYYVAAARAHGGFFEEGSFVAAARDLSVPHAPGAPIESLLAAAFALLPIGPLPFRVAMVSALCAALTLALFARALMSTLRHLGAAEGRFAALLALAASLWLGQTPLFFAQAVRPQAFAVQFAFSLLIIYTLLRFEEEEPHGSTRVLYFGAFLQGLSFANHHVYGLLMLPVAAPTLGRVFARRGFIGLMGYLTAPLVGFSVYLYVPLRLGHMPESGLAEQSGVARVVTMLSEEPYAGPSWAPAVSLSAVVRDGLALSSPGRLALIGLLLAVGLWVALRASHARRFGTLWFLAWVVPCVSVLSVLSPRVPEDAWGALLPSACALTALACAGCAYLCTRLLALPRALHDALGVLWLALALLALNQRATGEMRLANQLADEADEQLRRRLAPGALLFAEEASSGFWFRGREAEEALRADVRLVPLSLSARPHALEAWAKGTPELTEALRAFVLAGELDVGTLQSLSALRPVYVEPVPTLPRALYDSSLAEGLLLRVRGEGVTKRDASEAQSENARRLARISRLSDALPADSLVRAKIAHAIDVFHARDPARFQAEHAP